MLTTAPTEQETLVQAINRLREEGYKDNFQFIDGKMVNKDKNDAIYAAEELKIISFERFEGATNPADSSILYAMEAEDGSKGNFVSAYGTYAENDAASFIRKVAIQE
ncbi:MAG: phosphoribosylpyrophosphate synthetase [Bacteroidota bacterium]